MSDKGKECKAIAWLKKYNRVIFVVVLSLGAFSVILWKFSWVSEFLCKQGIKNQNIQSTVFLLLISAPVSFYFWLIRNKDRLDAIKEQQKSNEEAERSNKNARQNLEEVQYANNYTNFLQALTLLADKDRAQTRALGLQLLIQIKNVRKMFANEIDVATQGIDLQDANLVNANLHSANLQSAILTGANLQGANLTNANLEGVNLMDANLQSADLHGANLMDANLQNANLEGANLKGADLRSTIFHMFTEHTTTSSAKLLESEIDKEKV